MLPGWMGTFSEWVPMVCSGISGIFRIVIYIPPVRINTEATTLDIFLAIRIAGEVETPPLFPPVAAVHAPRSLQGERAHRSKYLGEELKCSHGD